MTIAHEPLSPGHKRSRSQSQDSSSKRLKMESGLGDLDLEAALAQATTNATLPAAHVLPSKEQVHESAPSQNHQPVHAEVRNIVYDPNTYMWVMSLPILENLVSFLCPAYSKSGLYFVWECYNNALPVYPDSFYVGTRPLFRNHKYCHLA